MKCDLTDNGVIVNDALTLKHLTCVCGLVTQKISPVRLVLWFVAEFCANGAGMQKERCMANGIPQSSSLGTPEPRLRHC